MRRLLLSTVVTALAGALLIAAPSPARAAGLVIDGGPLLPGVTTTVTLTADDTTQYSIEVPPGAVPTLTMTAVTPGAFVQAFQNNFFSFATISGDEPSTWYAELGRNFLTDPAPDVLTLSSFGADAQVTFVLSYGTDVTQDVAAGSPTAVAVQHAGDRALLRFDAGLADTVTVHVADVVLDGTGPAVDPAYTVSLRSPNFGDGPPLTEVAPGQFQPLTVGDDGPFLLIVDPVADRVGTLTVTVEVTPGTVGTLAYGQPTQIVLDKPNRTRRFALTTSGAAPTLLRAFAPDLRTADGSPGTATFELLLAGSTVPVASGSISDQTVVTVEAGSLPEGAPAVLRVTSGAGTTGSLTVSPQLDPGPATPLAAGTSNPVSLPAGVPTSRYSITASRGELVELFVDDVQLPDQAALGFVQLALESPYGFVTQTAFVFTTDNSVPVLAFTADIPGTWTLQISRPDFIGGTDGSFSATLFPLRETTTTLARTQPVDETVSVGTPGQVLELRMQGRAGHRMVVQLLNPTWTDPTRPVIDSPPLLARYELGGVAQTDFSEFRFPGLADSDVYLESLPLDQDGDVVVRIDPVGRATGSVRVVAYEAPETLGVLGAVGAPTTATITRPGESIRYSFDGTAGEPFALDVSQVALDGLPENSARVTLSGPDGVLAQNDVLPGQQLWLEPSPTTVPPSGVGVLPVTGTYTVVVDPHGNSTGSLVLTRARPRLITTPVRSGQQLTLAFQRGDVQRLTFSGTVGQRPVLRILASTVEPGETAAQLIDPSGRSVQQVLDFELGSSFQEFQTLSSSGTWTVELNPTGAFAGSTTLRFDLVTDPVRNAEVGALTRATWSVGQNPAYRVRLKAGERIAVDVRSIANFTPGGAASIAILGPDGFGRDFGQVGVPGSLAGPPPLWLEAPGTAPGDGTWTVLVDGVGATTGSVSFVIRTAADQVIPNRVGRATNVNIAKPVQQVALPFTVTSPGRPVTWKVTGSTFTEARLLLMGPFGFAVDAARIGPGDSSGTFFDGPFSRGTWSIVLDPVNGGTGKANLTFSYTG